MDHEDYQALTGTPKILSTHLAVEDLGNLTDPWTGDPSNSIPSDKCLTSKGNSGQVWSPEGRYSSHLFKLMCKAKMGPFASKLCNRDDIDSLLPTKEPSSKYHS